MVACSLRNRRPGELPRATPPRPAERHRSGESWPWPGWMHESVQKAGMLEPPTRPRSRWPRQLPSECDACPKVTSPTPAGARTRAFPAVIVENADQGCFDSLKGFSCNYLESCTRSTADGPTVKKHDICTLRTAILLRSPSHSTTPAKTDQSFDIREPWHAVRHGHCLFTWRRHD